MRWFVSLILSIIVECSTIGKKIAVPDSDPTLQELIYRSAVPRSNEQIHERIHDNVWWVPSGGHYQATKVTVINMGKQYTTYDFRLTLQKSQCDLYRTPLASLKKCKPITASPQVIVSLAADRFLLGSSSLSQQTVCQHCVSRGGICLQQG